MRARPRFPVEVGVAKGGESPLESCKGLHVNDNLYCGEPYEITLCDLPRRDKQAGFFWKRSAEGSTRRDAIVLEAFDAPEVREIDSFGDADPLTSKVAYVDAAVRPFLLSCAT